ncbi:MAG: hypothetical protein ABFC12_06860 [Methanobacterium sp.]
MEVYVSIFLLILLVVGTAGCTFQDFNFFDSNTTKITLATVLLLIIPGTGW